MPTYICPRCTQAGHTNCKIKLYPITRDHKDWPCKFSSNSENLFWGPNFEPPIKVIHGSECKSPMRGAMGANIQLDFPVVAWLGWVGVGVGIGVGVLKNHHVAQICLNRWIFLPMPKKCGVRNGSHQTEKIFWILSYHNNSEILWNSEW